VVCKKERAANCTTDRQSARASSVRRYVYRCTEHASYLVARPSTGTLKSNTYMCATAKVKKFQLSYNCWRMGDPVEHAQKSIGKTMRQLRHWPCANTITTTNVTDLDKCYRLRAPLQDSCCFIINAPADSEQREYDPCAHDWSCDLPHTESRIWLLSAPVPGLVASIYGENVTVQMKLQDIALKSTRR
jgi:hypothetical protein